MMKYHNMMFLIIGIFILLITFRVINHVENRQILDRFENNDNIKTVVVRQGIGFKLKFFESFNGNQYKLSK